MNLSHNDLQTLVQFANLLNILSTPDKLQETVAEAKRVLIESQALLGPAATVAGADAYKMKVEKDAEVLMQSLTNDRHELDAMKQQANHAIEERLAAVAAQEAAINQKNQLFEQWEKSIQERKLVVEADEAKSFQVAKELEQRVQHLVEQEAALAEKQEQLRKLLG